VNRGSHEVVLSDFALMTTEMRVNVNSIYIQSFAVDNLLAVAVPKP